MRDLSDHEFNKIVDFLRKLPERVDPSNRDRSWRTAEELIPLVDTKEAPWTEKRLDAALCMKFVDYENCPIRPANYPGATTCKRLWGHIDNVHHGPERDKLRAKLMAKPYPLESLQLDETAPTVFLSHAIEDHHLAARVRLELARHNLRSWLAEGDMHEGSNLFEAIEAALNRCDALMVLLSSCSIRSAWMYTEVQSALKDEKKHIAVVDASDTAMCALVRQWVTMRGKEDHWITTAEGVRMCANALERYICAGKSSTRILKYWSGVQKALNSSLIGEYVAFYPDLPSDFDGPPTCISFAEAITRLDLKTTSTSA